ncbi:hypothetical protein psyc5s11_46680 [Clostridium gelidum]|uniref:Motility protein n=1 Tax=Clostridium gelidum TaxID=704125 RepID=A0ABM7TB69_9CLOT|nr:YjfB family protein [Clostridium gelidum]BCZ48601.1 hypothetical protein psyc5s11_46680 [Clostridium gelidum]
MDIGTISTGMHQAAIQSAVSISVMKLAMNNGSQEATQMTDMISNMAVDTSKGMNIDARV